MLCSFNFGLLEQELETQLIYWHWLTAGVVLQDAPEE